MAAPLRTLHVDIEGGWGGSSRSLFELVSRLDPERLKPLIVHRQEGPLQDWYREAGIQTIHLPTLASYVPRRRKAFKNLLASLPRLRRLGPATRAIKALCIDHKIDAVHMNYEGLFLLARRLRRAGFSLPMVAHSRAHLPATRWGRWLVRTLDQQVAHMFFISPQEEARYRLLGGQSPGQVLWNISRPPAPRRSLDSPPEAVYFGTLDWTKGTDRLVDMAAALNRLQAPPLRIAVYGKARTDSAFADMLTKRIQNEGLHNRIRLAGYSTDPMSVMAGAIALIRPSRDNDPWGRDVIEATRAGLPIVASGSYDGVVIDGVTGYLLDPFDPDQAAAHLVRLVSDLAARARLVSAAEERGQALFSGAAQPLLFTSVVESLCRQDRLPVHRLKRKVSRI